MTHLKSRLWVTLSVFAFALVVGIGPVQAQELDRTLEIERYPDEPLQLVSLRIGTQSLKENIKQKSTDPQSKWGIDSVKFNEKDDWVKRLSITLRNASDKPIHGLTGMLFFKPLAIRKMFGLQLTFSKQLRQEPLQPGAEIELWVNESALDRTLSDAKSQGADLKVRL